MNVISVFILYLFCFINWSLMVELFEPTSLNLKYLYPNDQIKIEFNQTIKYPILLKKNPKLTYEENLDVFFKNDQKLNYHVTKIIQIDNEITHFPNKMLSNILPNLTEINLSNNLITSLNPLEDFSVILCRNKIERLDLSLNKINQIDDENFRYMVNLKYLNLSHNQINQVSLFAFSVDSHKIIELDLSNNLITDSSLEFLLFSSLTSLKHLNMDYNRLTSISNHFLYSLYNLESLSLKFNNLKSFDLFYLVNKNNEFLRSIDLSFNFNLKFQINLNDKNPDQSKYHENNIESLNLAGIDLSYLNLNKFLDNLFDNYVNLKNLNLSSTRIKSVLWSTKWPSTIKVIDLSNNLLKDSQFDCSQFYLSNKSFKINKIDLSNNRFRNFSQFTESCSKLFNETLVDLRMNLFENLYGIQKIDCLSQTSFLLGSNPLVCDCQANLWWEKLDSTKKCFKILDMSKLKCTSLSENSQENFQNFRIGFNRTNKLWKIEIFNKIEYESISRNLFCPYKKSCNTNKCECCGFKACDCESNCPVGCRCVKDYMDKFDLVDCAKSNFTLIPNSIPNSATELRLNQNGLKKIYPFQFFGRFKLQSIDLSDNQIGFIEENGFNNLKNLKILRFSGNNLQILLGYEFKELIRLEELYLENNKIQFISNHTFQNLKNLKILNLLGNNLRHFLEVKLFFKFNLNLLNLSLDQPNRNLIENEISQIDSSLSENVKMKKKFKKFDDFYFYNFIRYNLVNQENNLADLDSVIKCISSKFKHEIRGRLDPKLMKDILIGNLNNYKILCQGTKLLQSKSLELKSNLAYNLSSHLVGLIILGVLAVIFSVFLILLLNKYRKNSEFSCLNRIKTIFKLKFMVPFYKQKYEVTDLSLISTNKRPYYDLILVYNKIDSCLVTKLIAPIFRSKPYGFKLVLQHDKIKLNDDCIGKYVVNSAFVLFVLSKNLLTDFEYDIALKLPRSKKLAILADDVPESLAEKLIQPGRILRGTFNLENMSFNFKSINIYEDSVDSGLDAEKIMDFETLDESYVYRQGCSLNDSFDQHNLNNQRKIEF
ncbi:unnamed protein product [Brachionus calyciflorus]|uniref:Uncharacterized protein n=1 Tax=Brachionus calyciflorus TaxID=104777 RepID=A0A813PI02_9BILA|nr:unnamed protein product [Brachionus calyciflorus]